MERWGPRRGRTSGLLCFHWVLLEAVICRGVVIGEGICIGIRQGVLTHVVMAVDLVDDVSVAAGGSGEGWGG